MWKYPQESRKVIYLQFFYCTHDVVTIITIKSLKKLLVYLRNQIGQFKDRKESVLPWN